MNQGREHRDLSQGPGRAMTGRMRAYQSVSRFARSLTAGRMLPRDLDMPKALDVEELEDLYSAEHRILSALPRMSKAASNVRMTQALATHVRHRRYTGCRMDGRGA